MGFRWRGPRWASRTAKAPTETQTKLAEKPAVLRGATVGEALLATHRAYYKDVAPVLHLVDGMAHITGGGFEENVPRMLPDGTTAVVDTASWEVPGIFQLIEGRGEVPRAEMFRVFNMGVGLILAISKENAAEAKAALPEAWTIGRIVERGDGEAVLLAGL